VKAGTYIISVVVKTSNGSFLEGGSFSIFVESNSNNDLDAESFLVEEIDLNIVFPIKTNSAPHFDTEVF